LPSAIREQRSLRVSLDSRSQRLVSLASRIRQSLLCRRHVPMVPLFRVARLDPIDGKMHDACVTPQSTAKHRFALAIVFVSALE